MAQVSDADSLKSAVSALKPDVAIVDVRMPPNWQDEGARAAVEIRAEHPSVGVLLLSQSVETRHALALFRTGRGGFGYLLKDRVLAVDDFVDSLQRIDSGGSAIDPQVVAALVGAGPSRLDAQANENAPCWQSLRKVAATQPSRALCSSPRRRLRA